jgi:3-methyladenine DNA glycosylase AlkD
MGKQATEIPEAKMLESEIVSRISSLPVPNTEHVRAVRREFSRQIARYPPEMVVELAGRLVDKSHLLRFVGYELVLHHKPALQSLNARLLERLGQGLDSWVAVDTFASYLAGPAWRERQVSDKLIHRWARSEDRWWRRAALVSTVPLNNKARGGSGDVSRTLDICKILVTDHDDMVVKAMSWALRELSKRDPTAVRKFINSHQKVLAPRVIREVNNKLVTGLKNPGKSGKL